MNWEVLAALIPPCWIGDRVVGATLGRPRGLAMWLRHVGLALPLGLAVVAGLSWFMAMTLGTTIDVMLSAEAGIMLLAAGLKQRLGSPGPRLQGAPVVLLILMPVLAIGWHLVSNPWGDADALSIWNLRALFLYRAAGDWVSVFDTDWDAPGRMPHVDYPLLLPLLVARGFAWAGSETQDASAVLALVFGVAPIATLCGALAMQRNSVVGLGASAALAMTPIYIEVASSRIADVPLAGYILSTLVLMNERRPGPLLIAGVAAGAASFTKNEGILWAVLATGWYALLVLAGRRRASELFACLLGVLVVGLATLWFKLAFAPAQDLLAAQSGNATWDRIADPARWGTVALRFIRELGWFGGSYPGVPGLAVAAAIAVLLRPCALARFPCSGIVLLVAMVGAYFAAFVLTPYDLNWHLDTASARLLLQVWPAGLFLAGLSIAPDREAPSPSLGESGAHMRKDSTASPECPAQGAIDLP